MSQLVSYKPEFRSAVGPIIVFVLRYIGRHIRRSTWKSALALLLAALLFSAIGQLVLMRQSYDDLFKNTIITARVAGGLALPSAVQLAESSYTKNPYYEALGTVDANFQTISMTFTNDIARYVDEEAEITYAEGYDETSMNRLGDIIIVGLAFIEEHGFELGETILITRSGVSVGARYNHISQYRRFNPDTELTDDEIFALQERIIMSDIGTQANRLRIAGIFSTPSGKHDNIIISPGLYTPATIGMPPGVDMAEYTVADNELIDEFREEARKIMGGTTTDSDLIMDTGKIENIKNTRNLLRALYPMAVAAAMLIGAFLCCLIILQSSKDAAIMRVLGTTKFKTRIILSIEQVFLSIVGLLIGVCIMLALRSQEFPAIVGNLVVFASLYAAIILASAAVCSTLATQRSALELLQVKE